MKKILFPLLAPYLLLVFSACSPTPESPEDIEAEFIDRFESFIQEGDFSEEKMNEVWLFGDAPKSELTRKVTDFEKLKEHGIGETRFHEIYPQILVGMEQPFKIEDALYLPNLKPYKMVEFVFSEEIELENGKENGWSMVVGESQGKLYLMGYQKAEPVGTGQPM